MNDFPLPEFNFNLLECKSSLLVNERLIQGCFTKLAKTDNNGYHSDDDDDDDDGGFRQHKSHSDIFTWELEVSNNPWVDRIMNSDQISELGKIYSGQA